MVLGDGIRRYIFKVDPKERERLRNAILELNSKDSKFHYPGDRDDPDGVGGVSYWFKQDEIHQATHVHGGPAFLPWHRELCNRFEKLLRNVNKDLSLHYWDWNIDPIDLFTEGTDGFMGNAKDLAGNPWKDGGFYDENAANFRSDDEDDPEHSNPFDPPKHVKREKQEGTLKSYIDRVREKEPRKPPFYSDQEIVESETFPEMRLKLESDHNYAHGYIGGTIGEQHTAFRDPFVFLLHSNVDRLFAMWQRQPAHEWRLDPKQVYGKEGGSTSTGSGKNVSVGILTLLSPWAGEVPNAEPGLKPTRPWAEPDNWHKQCFDENTKDSKHPTVVYPPDYDTTEELLKKL